MSLNDGKRQVDLVFGALVLDGLAAVAVLIRAADAGADHLTNGSPLPQLGHIELPCFHMAGFYKYGGFYFFVHIITSLNQANVWTSA